MATRKAAPDAQSPRLNRGFTLVEIAVVLGIIALILGALLPLISAQTANTRINATRSREEAVRTALSTFIGRHGYLPCPADGGLLPGDPLYGREARTPVTSLPAPLACDLMVNRGGAPLSRQDVDPSLNTNPRYPLVTVYRGVVPWLDLGLPEDSANDAWNQRLTYVVSSVSVQGYASREAASGLLGGLVVCDSYGSAAARLLTPIPSPLGGASAALNLPCTAPANAPLISTLSAAAVLISHGENGYGAYVPPRPGSATAAFKPYSAAGQASAAEKANIDLSMNALVQAPYSRSFDDVVLWLTPSDLVGPLVAAGTLPSPQALLTARFNEAREAILASLVANRSLFPASQPVAGSSPQAYEYFLCPVVLDGSKVDAGGNPVTLFGDTLSTTAGEQIASSQWPAGASAFSDPTKWSFALQNLSTDAADLAAEGGSPNFDPWGNPILLTTTRTSPSAALPELLTLTDPLPTQPDANRTYAFVLYAPGPDGLLGTIDDGSSGMTFNDLRLALQQTRPLAPARDSASGTCPSSPGAGGSKRD